LPKLSSLVAPGKWKWREQGTLLPLLPLYLLGGVKFGLSVQLEPDPTPPGPRRERISLKQDDIQSLLVPWRGALAGFTCCETPSAPLPWLGEGAGGMLSSSYSGEVFPAYGRQASSLFPALDQAAFGL